MKNEKLADDCLIENGKLTREEQVCRSTVSSFRGLGQTKNKKIKKAKMKQYIPILILGVILFSCKEELLLEEPIIEKPSFILKAGDAINDTLFYHEFDPYISVKGYRVGNDTNYVYHDSARIDINNDESFDLYFEYYLKLVYYPSLEDSIDVCNFPDVTHHCSLRTSNNIEIAIDSQIGFTMPKVFGMGQTIDNNEEWLALSGETDFSFAGMGDYWDSNHYNNFMGFRQITDTDTLYGWIRINTFNSSKIEIYDFAIEKIIE